MIRALVGYPERGTGLAGDRCASLPDGWSGRNARYAMHRIGLAAFRCFPCGVRPFCRTGVPFRRVGASRTRGRRSAGAFRWRVSGDHCGSGEVRAGVGDTVSRRARVGGVGRFGAFPLPQAALRAVPDMPCGRRGGVLPRLHLGVVGCAGPKPGPAVGAGVRASPGRDRQTGLREPRGAGRAFRGRAAAGPFGRRPPLPPGALRSGPGRRRQPHPRMQTVESPDIRRTPAGTVPQGTRRTVGRCPGKHLHRYRWMVDPPLRDGADA